MSRQRFVYPEQYYGGFFGYITPYNDGKNVNLIRGGGTMYGATQIPKTTITAANVCSPPRYDVTAYQMAPQTPEVKAIAAAELPYANLFNTTLGYVPSTY